MFYTSEEMYIDAFYTAVNADYTDDIAFYQDCCRLYGQHVLEACCGNGRVTLPLKEVCDDVSGFDLSDQMLEVAVKKARALKMKISFYKMDMRMLSLPRQYDLILMPFNSLQYLYTLSDQKCALKNICKHLIPGGHFIFDVFNPKISRIIDRENHERLLKYIKLADGSEASIYETVHYVADKQVLCSRWRIVNNDNEYHLELDSHCFFPFELQHLIEGQGFIIDNIYGSFKKGAFDSASSKQIIVCHISK